MNDQSVSLAANARVRITLYCGTNQTRFGSTNNVDELGRIFQGTHLAIAEVR